jgi:hypothetical protein
VGKNGVTVGQSTRYLKTSRKPIILLEEMYYTIFSLNSVYPCRLIKMSLNETYSDVRTGKHLSDAFPIQNGL